MTLYSPYIGNTVLQTVGGQVSVRTGESPTSALVSVMNQSGAILQSGLVATGSNVGQTLQLQPSTGQKVSIAVTGVSPGLVTNVVSGANVQMGSPNAAAQQRAHFMKQVGAKQQQQIGRSITMPVTEEMLLVKRQMVGQAAAQQAAQPTAQVQHQQSPQQSSQSPQQQAKTQILQQAFSPLLQSAGGLALVKTSTGAMVSDE